MKSLKATLITMATILSLTVPPALSQPNPALRWEKDIQTFMQWDSKNSFPENAVLFVGSSSIRMWKTQQSFPDQKVINRGFGGSQVPDLLYYYDQLVLKYHPQIIVLYSGDNDIAVGKSAETTSNNYRSFIQLTHDKLPGTPIVLIPIKPSGARWNYWPEMSKTNGLLKEIAAADKLVTYTDCATVLLNDNGQPNNALFQQDQLHLNDAGYQLWANIVKETLSRISKPLKTPKQHPGHEHN